MVKTLYFVLKNKNIRRDTLMECLNKNKYFYKNMAIFVCINHKIKKIIYAMRYAMQNNIKLMRSQFEVVRK